MYFSLSNFFVGIIGMILGVMMVKEAFFLNHHVLFLSWVEQKWGSGKGTLAYKLAGLAIIVFCMFVSVGQIDLMGNVTGTPTNSVSKTKVNNTGSQAQVKTVPGIAP